MEATDAAYVAGIMDGEGSIMLAEVSVLSKNSYQPRLTVANTSLRMLEHLVRVTQSGTIVGKRVRENRKNAYAWLCGSRDVRRVLEAIRPHLVVKRQQAELVLEWLDLRQEAKLVRKKGVLPEAQSRGVEIYNRVRELNRRGVTVPLEPGQADRISDIPYRARQKTGEEMEARVLELLRSGELTAARIAEHLGISRTVVRRLARENNIATPHPSGAEHWVNRRRETGEGLRSAECAVCQRPFETVYPRQRFCGQPCQMKWHSDRQKAARQQRRQQEADPEQQARDDRLLKAIFTRAKEIEQRHPPQEAEGSRCKQCDGPHDRWDQEYCPACIEARMGSFERRQPQGAS